MTRFGRFARYAGMAVMLWLAALLVLNVVLFGGTRRRIAERLGDSLQALATIDRGSLALIRGWIDLEDLMLRRDDLVGHLSITASRIHCELPPLGLGLFDRDCRDLVVRQTRLEVSTAALFRLRPPKRPPLRARRVVIEDARLEFSPSAFMPSLGRVAIDIERAEAGPTVFKTPLSWIFALRELRATVELPAGIALRLSYEDGTLRVAGSVVGATPVELPLALPVAAPADDASAEIARLVALGKDIAERVVARKAEDWVRSKLAP
ncbi:MAG TPA: hypothetical protein VFD36_07330 [Kofleriaceae bacterium]|nr:hypothetical protein [Kofleriaceae bacterium]